MLAGRCWPWWSILEEEFEWAEPLAPQPRGTASIKAPRVAHTLFAHYGIRPTYLVTYSLASEIAAIGVLREYLADGLCDICAQLHPWVTPPFRQGETEAQSYPGNLPVAVEREKPARLTDAIETACGRRPTAYKAGWHGFGPNTAALLEEAGYEIDTSLIPRTSYAESGGPDFSGHDDRPFWFGARRRLLELPLTRALTGALSKRMPWLHQMAESRPWRSMHAGGLLTRAGLVERITLSPEGSDLAAMCRLTRALLAGGLRVLTLSYHSTSLEPGHTPYVRNERDLAIFLDRISGFLSFFRDEIGGEFLTIAETRARLLSAVPDVAASAPPSRPPLAPGKRCLVVATTFPPVHGGSAVVYDSLARFGRGRVSVLAPRHDYRFEWPIRIWREFDRAAPFPVHRVHLLRTPLLDEAPTLRQRVAAAVRDVAIRIDLLRAIRRVARAENISVVCIGELAASGWLAAACRRLFGLRSIIYIHGEEISSRMSYDVDVDVDVDGVRRRRALAQTGGIVAVSRFTREALETTMGYRRTRLR